MMCEQHAVVLTKDNYEIYWCDLKQTILVVRYWGKMLWEDGDEIVGFVNEQIVRPDRTTYVISWRDGTDFVVSLDQPVANLVRMWTTLRYLPAMLVYVNAPTILRAFFEMAGDVPAMRQLADRLHFVDTVASALVLIDAHKHHNAP